MAELVSFTAGRSVGERMLTVGLSSLQPVAISMGDTNSLMVFDHPPQHDRPTRLCMLQERLASFARAVVLPALHQGQPWPRRAVAVMLGNRHMEISVAAPSDHPITTITRTVRFDRTPWPEHESPNLGSDVIGAWVPLDAAAGPWVIPNLKSPLVRQTCNLLGAWGLRALRESTQTAAPH